jgi:L-lactate dehydrogenase complex protein LldG
MEESTSREKVLKKIREALISKTDPPYPKIDYESSLYHELQEPEDITFAQELTAAGGRFIYCVNESELVENLQLLVAERKLTRLFAAEPAVRELLEMAGVPYISEKEKFHELNAGMTSCEFLVARLGSIMVSTAQGSGRRLMVFPEVHLVLAYASQLLPDLRDALSGIKKKYEHSMPSMITLITGPSRTADIEKTLVMGAHGPRELYVFFVEDRTQL